MSRCCDRKDARDYCPEKGLLALILLSEDRRRYKTQQRGAVRLPDEGSEFLPEPAQRITAHRPDDLLERQPGDIEHGCEQLSRRCFLLLGKDRRGSGRGR